MHSAAPIAMAQVDIAKEVRLAAATLAAATRDEGILAVTSDN